MTGINADKLRRLRTVLLGGFRGPKAALGRFRGIDESDL
jgi:hypothetical protein